MADNNFIQTGALCLSPIMTRRPTDKFFILLLPINFSFWLGIGIYEMCIESEHRDALSQGAVRKTNKQFDDGDLNLILLRSLLNITIYAIVSAVITIAFLFITTALKPKSIVYTAILLIVITIISSLMLIPWEIILLISDSLKSQSLLLLTVAIMVTILYLIYQVTIFVYAKETNMSLSAELISKSCAAILHSFKTILVSLVLAFLSMIVLTITINITLSKIFDSFSSEFHRKLIKEKEPSNLDLLRISIFFIGGIYTFNFIWNFGLMIVGDYSANIYARSNNQKNSNVNIFQSISRIARYHLGTLAFLSTPILPSICALNMAFKTHDQFNTKSSYRSIRFFSKLCLISDISDYALIHTSIYGYKSLKSIIEMFDLQQRSSLLFLILNAISTKAIEICIVVATIIGLIIRIFSVPMYHDIPFTRLMQNVTEEMMFYEIFVAAIYINFMCKSVTRSAMCTFAIYQMTSVRMSEALEDRIAIADQPI